MLTHGLRNLFLAQTAITSLVPAQTVGRVSLPCVFCEDAAEGVRPPYVVIRHDDTDPLMTLDPTYHGTGQIDTIEVDSVAYTETDAKALNKVVRTFFQDYSGAVTADAITDTVMAVEWHDENYDDDYPQDGTDKKVRAMTTTYSVLFKQGA